MNIDHIKQLHFDDVYIEPRLSDVNSRSEVSLARTFKGLKLSLPFITSPMKGIVGTNLIIELSKLGGIGILHRFHKSDSEWRNDIAKLEDSGCNFGIAVGLNADVMNIRYALTHGAKIICVDIANGYIKSLRDYCYTIAPIIHLNEALLMTGNVVDWSGVEALAKSGVDMIRCGIGSGNLCSTTMVTGIGKPQLQTILDCSEQEDTRLAPSKFKFASDLGVSIVSDGGITSTGDMVKALAAGADFLMMGTLFAEALESDNNGTIYGMASRRLQDDYFTEVKSIEGREMEVEKKRPLKEIVEEWSWNIKSACTYVDAKDLNGLYNNAHFIRVM